MSEPALRKQKVFIIYNSGARNDDSPLKSLNELLDKGWRVLEVHPSNGDGAWYLVVAQETFPED
jgi:hypothetical protein